jgi:hypothetical protein
MPAFAVDQNDGEIMPAESEPLLDASRNCDLHTAAWNTLSLAEHPHGSGTVVYLKNTRAHRSIGIGYTPCDSDLSSGESARVAVNLGYPFARRASRQQYGSGTD